MGLLQKEGAQCCGTSLVQSHIIFEICRNPGISLNELAEKLGLDNSTMSRHIQTLSKRGYVLGKQGETDRRFLALFLTPAGEKVQHNNSDQMVAYLSELMEQIPADKRSQVVESMEILSAALVKSSWCCTPLV